MNEYTEQAKNFCEKWGVEINIKPFAIDKAPWDEEEDRVHYKIEIKRDNKRFNLDFWGSIDELKKYTSQVVKKYPSKSRNIALNMNHFIMEKLNSGRLDIKISKYDVLTAIEKSFDGSIDDFINEFEFEINSRKDYIKMENVYHETIKQRRNVRSMFPEPEAIEELQNIQ